MLGREHPDPGELPRRRLFRLVRKLTQHLDSLSHLIVIQSVDQAVRVVTGTAHGPECSQLAQRGESRSSPP